MGRKKKNRKGVDISGKLPQSKWIVTALTLYLVVNPVSKCRLKLLRTERVKDYLIMEEEFIKNQERLKPQEENKEKERLKVDEMRGTPMNVGTLEEIIDDEHAIVSPH